MANRQQIFDRVEHIAHSNFDKADSAKITEITKIQSDLMADSLDFIEFIVSLEQEFSIDIPDEEAEEIVTIGDAVDCVIQHNGYLI